MLTGGPMIPRFEDAGIGTVGPKYIAEMGGDAPVIFFAATRGWAEDNPEGGRAVPPGRWRAASS